MSQIEKQTQKQHTDCTCRDPDSATSALTFLLKPDVNSLYNEKHDHRSHNGTSAVTDKRQRYTCQRDKLGSSANRQKNLKNIHNTDAIYDQLIKAVVNLYRNPHHFQKTADTDQNQAHSKDNSQFLTNG